MRSPFAPFAIALIGVGVSACGTSKVAGSASPTSSTTPTQSSLSRDYDNDHDIDPSSHYDNDLYFGHAANAANRRVVTAVIKRYYTAAAAGNGAIACSMMYSRLAKEIPDVYGQSPPGPPALRGKTCAVVMSKLFEQRHHQLVTDDATLNVTGVLVEGERGLVLLRFEETPKRHIFVQLERGSWKVNMLIDAGPPQQGN